MPFEKGISFNKDNKMHPLPTPSSRILISFFIKIFANSIPLETKTSLSGLGSSVESFMQNSEFQKFLFLIILLTGFPLALSFIIEKNSSCFLFETLMSDSKYLSSIFNIVQSKILVSK